MQLPTDAEVRLLVAAAQQHDEGAYDRLYSLYAEPLYHFFVYRCKDPHIAEDLTSGVFLRVVEALPRFVTPPQSPALALTSWLFRIARNLLSDFQQRRRPQVALDERWAGGQQPGDTVERQLEYEEVRAAMLQLTDEQQQVVMLRFVEDLSLEDVATITGQTVGGVKSMQHRALRRLSTLLDHFRDPHKG